MTERQLEAYRKMYKILGAAKDEIHNPGFNRVTGVSILDEIEDARLQALSVAPDEF